MDETRRDFHWGLKDETWGRAARGVALVGTVFCAVVAVLLIVTQVERTRTDPASSKALAVLAEQFKADPKSEVLQAGIRDLDLLARRAFFGSLAFIDAAAVALLLGILLTLAALRLSEALRPELPKVDAVDEGDPAQSRSVLRWALAGLGVVVVFFALFYPRLSGERRITAGAALASANGTAVQAAAQRAPVPATGAPGKVARAIPGASREDFLKNWPNLRGPFGLGIAYGAKPPTQWDGATGKQIRWKTEVPKGGFNSPVVWGERVFLSGADASSREVYCFDAGSGKLRWQRAVASSAPTPKVSDDTGFAAPTVCVDGERVFAVFATGDVVAFDFEGKEIWKRHFDVGANHYGYASSPIFWKYLFLQVDVDTGGALHALDPQTGKTVWTKTRRVDTSWASPVVVADAGREWVVCAASPNLIAYDIATGAETLSVACLAGEVAPSAAYAMGVLVSAMEYGSLTAIPLATGKKAWSSEDDLPSTSSPLATPSFVFTVNANGIANAYELAGGKKLWNHEWNGEFYPSPILAGELVFFSDNKGVTHIAKADRGFAQVGEPALGEGSASTPAFVGSRLYHRGKKFLYCIGAE
ncbi:MAG: PQQ-binding-like beta-propeller repeat protein [Spirochaetes bacterium]|nr:PQQ-binding-like beta-propeller repeat protein [Spirochaetota bacterium]